MTKYASLLLIILASLAVLEGLSFLTRLEPTNQGHTLALAGIATFAIKFGISELLSSDGFSGEKAAVDLALVLCSTSFALATIQQYSPDHSVFPAIVVLVDGAGAQITAARSGFLMWCVFGLSLFMFLASFSLAQRLRARVGAVPRAGVREGLSSLMRLAIYACFTISYSMYMITILYRA